MMKENFKFIFIFAVLGVLLNGCGTIKSGHYVLLEKNIGPAELSKYYHVSEDTIVQANQDKPFIKGQWIFIPKKTGVITAFKSEPIGEGPLDLKSYGKQFVWPVPTVHGVSSGYGGRWGRKHEGIDIPANTGTPFISVDDGVVIYSGRGIRAYGNLTVVAHKDGFFSVYAHAKKNFCNKGQKIFKGQVIGLVGRTGRATGPHLHFELRKESRSLNPIDLLVKN